MRSIAWGVATLVALSVSACGGGGGGGATAPAPAPLVTVDASNQVAVARVTLRGGQAVGESPTGTTPRSSIQSASVPPAPAGVDVLGSAVARGVAAVTAPRRTASIASATRPAVVVTANQPCAVSGSVTVSVDDRDDNGVESPGDSLHAAFNQCIDVPGETMNGVMVITLGEAPTPTLLRGTVAFHGLSIAAGGSSAALDGSVALSIAEAGLTTQVSFAVGADSLTVRTAGGTVDDTLVYNAGMQITVTETTGVVPSTSFALDGSFSSTSIGGRVTVRTVQPVMRRSTESRASSGEVVVTGLNGSLLRIVVLDATQVQLSLDGTGDGAFEASRIEPWATLNPQ